MKYQHSSLASFIEPASLRVEQQKSKMELDTKVLGTISLIDTLYGYTQQMRFSQMYISVAFFMLYAKCRYNECHNHECHSAFKQHVISSSLYCQKFTAVINADAGNTN